MGIGGVYRYSSANRTKIGKRIVSTPENLLHFVYNIKILATLRSMWRNSINLLTDSERIDRILDHIDNKTTDLGEKVWREPTSSYATQERFDAEIELLRRSPTPFAPPLCCPRMVVTSQEKPLARRFW